MLQNYSGLPNITSCSDPPQYQGLWCEDRPEGHIVWACVGVVCFIFGFPAAVSVLWEMLQRGRKGGHFTSHDVFVLNATIIDLVYLSFCLPMLYNSAHGHSFEFQAFIGFVLAFNQCGRPLFTTCICVDCYLAVVHPVVYHANKTLTPRILMAVGVWTMTLIFGGIYLNFNKTLDSFVLVLIFALTLPVIGFCDVTILWTLKRPKPAGGAVHPKKKKALQVIINNLVITFTSYFPPLICTLVTQFPILSKTARYCLVIIPVMCSMLIGNTVSPILYVNSLGKLDWMKHAWQKKVMDPLVLCCKVC